MSRLQLFTYTALQVCFVLGIQQRVNINPSVMAGRGGRRSQNRDQNTSELKDTDSLSSLNVGSIRQLMREEVATIMKPHMDNLAKLFKNETKKLHKSVTKLEKKVESLSGLKEHVEKQAEYTDSRFRDLYDVVFPKMNAQLTEIATALTNRMMDLDVHRRKWSLNVQGLPGEAGEDERTTRTKVVDFAKKKLGIQSAAVTDYAACHRLSQAQNAGIIMRFLDLSQRNAWLDRAKNLKRFPDCKKISISPDLPNDLRPLKTELLNKRKNLPDEQKKNSSIRFLKDWPYVELRIKNHPTIRPTESVTHVCERVLGMEKDSLLLNIPEPEREAPDALSEYEEEDGDDEDDEEEESDEGEEEEDDITQY